MLDVRWAKLDRQTDGQKDKRTDGRSKPDAPAELSGRGINVLRYIFMLR